MFRDRQRTAMVRRLIRRCNARIHKEAPARLAKTIFDLSSTVIKILVISREKI